MDFAPGDKVWAHHYDPALVKTTIRLPGTLVRSYKFIDEVHWLVELPDLGRTLSHKESWLERREV